jgi:hypothetical protein
LAFVAPSIRAVTNKTARRFLSFGYWRGAHPNEFACYTATGAAIFISGEKLSPVMLDLVLPLAESRLEFTNSAPQIALSAERQCESCSHRFGLRRWLADHLIRRRGPTAPAWS